MDFLDKLQGVDDATERNRLGFQFLGEEGYKQMSRLVSSGVDVRDALEKIGVPFTEEDVQAAADYDAAMLNLSLTSTRTQQSLGRLFLPVITAIAEGIGDVVDVVQDVPVPLALATAAAITLGITGFTPAALAGGRLAAAFAAASASMATFRATAALTSVSAATWALRPVAPRPAPAGWWGSWAVRWAWACWRWVAPGRWRPVARTHSRSPPGRRQRNWQPPRMRRTALRCLSSGWPGGWWKTPASGSCTRPALAARKMRWTTRAPRTRPGSWRWVTCSAATNWPRRVSRRRSGRPGTRWVRSDPSRPTAQIATKELNDLIAEGTTSGDKFAEAVQRAAEAEAAQTATSDLAEAALAAYNATTRDAVQTQLDLLNAHLSQSDAMIGLKQAVHEASDVVDDAKTPWNEVEEATNRVIGAALNYAGTAADAAVAAATANGQVVDFADGGADPRGRHHQRAAGIAERARPDRRCAGTDHANDRGPAGGQGLRGHRGCPRRPARTRRAASWTTPRRTGTPRSGWSPRRTGRETLPGRAGGAAAGAHPGGVRNGPAVDAYLDSLAADRLAIIRVESRNGPGRGCLPGRVGGAGAHGLHRRAGTRRRRGREQVRWAAAAPGAPGMFPQPAQRGAGGDLVVQQLNGAGDRRLRWPADAAVPGRGRPAGGAGHRAYEQRNGRSWRRGA